MGDSIVTLRSTPVALDSDVGRAFVVDATRAAEGLLSDSELAIKYELSPADWQAIAKDVALGRAIRAERERRVHSGIAAKESAAKHFVKMPTILAGIAESPASNPRHVIEAAKEIRTVASGGDNTNRPADSDRFIIHIDLSADTGVRHVETYNKSRKVDPADGDDPNNLIDITPAPAVTTSGSPPLTPYEIALLALMERD
jgi:hypothetical protein